MCHTETNKIQLLCILFSFKQKLYLMCINKLYRKYKIQKGVYRIGGGVHKLTLLVR